MVRIFEAFATVSIAADVASTKIVTAFAHTAVERFASITRACTVAASGAAQAAIDRFLAS